MNSDLADQLTKGYEYKRRNIDNITSKEENTRRRCLLRLQKYIEEKNIPFYKVVSMTTDGVPSITDTVNGFLAICMRDDDFSHFLSYHCIIHQQALCCKILNMRHVMGICMKIVNSIRGRSLQRRIFRAHLEENESDYGELLYHADVLWLSRSIFLQRFRDLPQEGIPTTLNRKILMEDRRQLEWIIGFPQSMRLSVDDIFHYWKLTKTGICDQHDASSRNVLPHTPTKGENKHVELADIHFIYDLADGNGRAAVRLYRERYPTRRQPNHQTFARVHQNLVERGSFRAAIEGTGRRRIARTPIFEEGVLHAVDQTPGTSVRALAASTGRSPTTIHRVLQGAALHPFQVQRVQSLQPDDPHDVPRLHSGFLTKLRQTCTLPVPCCSVMKQPFHVKVCSIRTMRTCGP
ncbi:general transcription factor II-I repeat domain-containing protein 2B [Trichonephila clavipes]|nr:general transcription factor II-I repeat domain-containing protein 2B [Trichonephila clavipes]